MSDPDDGPLAVPPEVYGQLEALRESGGYNMLTEIERGLDEMGMDEAGEWFRDNKQEYFESALKGGFEPEQRTTRE